MTNIESLQNWKSILYTNADSLFLVVPFSRAGDFLYERLDLLENKVKASVRNYNRKYYNNVRRVDYDYNYEYVDDDDYYY